jgi:hypothetical protein
VQDFKAVLYLLQAKVSLVECVRSLNWVWTPRLPVGARHIISHLLFPTPMEKLLASKAAIGLHAWLNSSKTCDT